MISDKVLVLVPAEVLLPLPELVPGLYKLGQFIYAIIAATFPNFIEVRGQEVSVLVPELVLLLVLAIALGFCGPGILYYKKLAACCPIFIEIRSLEVSEEALT